MAKYLVETFYTCTFKVSHYLDKIDEKELENLEKKEDGKFEILTAGEFSKLFGLAFIDIFNYSLFLYTIKRLSATFTTLVDYVVPIVGILVGYIFLDEIVDNIFFVTLILIFISLYLAVKDESENLN